MPISANLIEHRERVELLVDGLSAPLVSEEERWDPERKQTCAVTNNANSESFRSLHDPPLFQIKFNINQSLTD